MGLRGIILLNIIGIIVNVKVASLQDNTIYTNLTTKLNKSPSGVAITATIICEVTSVIQPPPPPTFLTSLSIDGKMYETYIDSDESVSTSGYYETLCLLERPKSSGEFNLSTFFPPSKKWTAEYEIKSLNVTTITLNLTLKDIQCRDSGPYQCITDVVNETELRRSKYMEVTTSAPIIIDLNFEPNNETDKRSAKIKLGLNVTLTCNITGPPDLKIFWKFANRSSDEEVYLKEFIFNAGKKWVSETGCVVRSYTSEINKTVQRYEHGATYHCCVMNSKDELIAREQFTIWIKDLPDQNKDQGNDSDNHNPDQNRDQGNDSDNHNPDQNRDQGNDSDNHNPDQNRDQGNDSDNHNPDQNRDQGNDSDNHNPDQNRDQRKDNDNHNPDQNRDQTNDSDNHNGKVLFTFLYMKQHLALLLTIYIFVTD